MLSAVDSCRIERYDRALVSFHNRNTLSAQDKPNEGIGAARDYIYRQFQQFTAASGGRLTVRLQTYMQPKVAGALPRATRITNVVATLRGTQPASVGRTYVGSGHYDSRCTDVLDTKCFAPGADDDASGVSGVLEMARVMSTHRFDATIVFMAVAGEEQGLFGSTHFVQVAKKQHVNVAGMLDNDIIGTANGDDPHSVRLFSEGVPSDETPQEAAIREAVGGEHDSPARQLARFVKDVADNRATGMNVDLIFRRARYLRGGDHIPFLTNGYRSAVRFTEARENFNHEHQNVRWKTGFSSATSYASWTSPTSPGSPGSTSPASPRSPAHRPAPAARISSQPSSPMTRRCGGSQTPSPTSPVTRSSGVTRRRRCGSTRSEWATGRRSPCTYQRTTSSSASAPSTSKATGDRSASPAPSSADDRRSRKVPSGRSSMPSA